MSRWAYKVGTQRTSIGDGLQLFSFLGAVLAILRRLGVGSIGVAGTEKSPAY